MSNPIADIRRDYRLETLMESDVCSDPIEQFSRWWDEAINSQIDEVNAMTLATATASGIPTARIVLLKGYDRDGFVFLPITIAGRDKKLQPTQMCHCCFSGRNWSVRCGSTDS